MSNVLELTSTDELIAEMARRFENAVLAYDRTATTGPNSERTYTTTVLGDPFRCYFLTGRLQHQIMMTVDLMEVPEANL